MPAAGEGEADSAAVAVILVVIVAVIIITAFVSCICTRLFASDDPQHLCGDFETIHFHNKSKLQMAEPPPTCPICLDRPEEDDLLKGLPDCGHLFHEKCVDPWLELHPTCPICRRLSPLPTPTSTPLSWMAMPRDA